MKSELWWISVGGNSCEPARIVGEKIFTIGCQDGTSIPDKGIELIERITYAPLTSKQSEAKRIAWDKKIERDAKRGIHHGYRKFD